MAFYALDSFQSAQSPHRELRHLLRNHLCTISGLERDPDFVAALSPASGNRPARVYQTTFWPLLAYSAPLAVSRIEVNELLCNHGTQYSVSQLTFIYPCLTVRIIRPRNVEVLPMLIWYCRLCCQPSRSFLRSHQPQRGKHSRPHPADG